MGIKKSHLPAGLLFPFPCDQTAVGEVSLKLWPCPPRCTSLMMTDWSLCVCDLQATLLSWTKGVRATDCEGHHVVRMLQEAIERRNVRLRTAGGRMSRFSDWLHIYLLYE